jgi:peptidoglycan/LPS O-acetylase OafA/YrhL
MVSRLRPHRRRNIRIVWFATAAAVATLIGVLVGVSAVEHDSMFDGVTAAIWFWLTGFCVAAALIGDSQ